MIINVLNNKPLPVYGKGEDVRDLLYVEDHCRAIDLTIHKGRVGEVYNIGGHNEMRNIDIVKLILKELGKDESLITFASISGTGPSGSIPSSRPLAATSLTECFEMCQDVAMLLCEVFLISSSRILRTLIFLAMSASLELISAADKAADVMILRRC